MRSGTFIPMWQVLVSGIPFRGGFRSRAEADRLAQKIHWDGEETETVRDHKAEKEMAESYDVLKRGSRQTQIVEHYR